MTVALLSTTSDEAVAAAAETSRSFAGLDGASVRFEIVGPREAPVIAVLGGISASKHVTSSAADPSPGWWEDVVGPGRAIDTLRFRVLGIDYVTSGKSSAPVTTADQAEALAIALDRA
ncbi:MAG TPA: hypothetical protein VF387_03775, partial [Gemmatimonadaceae bacterium]